MNAAIHPIIAAAALPANVQLRNGQVALLERIEANTRYGLPLVGRLSILGNRPLEELGKYHLWTAQGHFATDNSAHLLDIVAIINPDGTLTPLGEEAAR